MSYQPHLHRENELYHSRPFGSRNGISNTPGYKAVGKLARFVVRGGKRIYESAGRLWDGQAGQGTGRDTASAYKRYEGRAIQEGNSSKAKTYHKQAQNAQSAYDRSIVGRARSLGNWMNDRGKQASNAASRAGNFISNIAKRARTAIGNAWDGQAGQGSGRDTANAYKRYEDRAIKEGNSSKAKTYHKQAQNAQSAYDRSIVGRFNAARDWLGRRANDVGEAANRARTAIGNAWDGSAGRGSAKDKANAAAANAKQYHDYARRNAQAGNASTGSAYAKASREAQAEARRQQEAYDRSIVGTGERLLNRAGSAIRGGAAAVSSGVKRAGKAASDSYVRSGARNAAKTLTTKGPIQIGKNMANASGGREAQQAKGNKLNVQNANRSAQERKQYVQQVDRDWGNAQRYLDRLQDKANNAKTDKDLQKALANIDRFMNETYKPAQTAYNNVHKKK